jgi:hypothetical protein
VDNTSDANKPVSTATIAALALKANLDSPAFTGTVTGLSKATVGLANVDNTSDANKPVSLATQTALDGKQTKFIHGTIPSSNCIRVFDSGSSKIRAIACETPLSVNSTMGGESYMSLALDDFLGSRSFNVVTAAQVRTTGATVSGGNVPAFIENTSVGGYASLYIQAPNEVAQLYVGQGGGLYVTTNTAHPIRFLVNRFTTPATALEITTAGNTNINGDLSVNGFFSMKPWCAVLITTTDTSTGAFTVTSFGKQTISASNVTRAGTGSMAYTIAFPTAHPNGTNCGVFVTPHTPLSATWTNTYYFIPTAKMESGGEKCTIWCRIPGAAQTLATGYVHGSFYVHTIP